MSDAMSPTGPAQPTLQQAYTTPGNPASSDPAEAKATSKTAEDNASTSRSDQRIPSTQASYQEATPTSLARGIHGTDPADRAGASSSSNSDIGPDGQTSDHHGQTEQMQMGAPGEGKVASSVRAKPGASGAQPGLESDLDRKKTEQADARREVDAQT